MEVNGKKTFGYDEPIIYKQYNPRMKYCDKIPVCRIQKFNMKYEIERMEINYTFYFCLF